MENPDDPNRFVEDAIVDDVLTNATVAKSGRDVVSVCSQFGVHQEIADGFRDSSCIVILLLLSPGGERVVEERLKIGLRLFGELDLTG
jgi:hypothetical protein